jgi:tetratricopeptide (TPR) repeat protein
MWNKRHLLAAAGALLACGGVGALAFEHFRITASDYRLQRGLEAARAGDYANATHYADLLDAAGEGGRRHLLLAEIHFQRGQFDRALAALRGAAVEGEFRVRAADLTARCLLGVGDRPAAEQAFRAFLALRPDDVDAHRFLAIIYYDQGDSGRALPHLEALARLDSADARPHRLTGLIYKDLDQWSEAVEGYREALRRHLDGPAAAEVRTELAECLLKQQQATEALEALADLDTPEADALRVEALLLLGRTADAEHLLDEALRKTQSQHADLQRLQAERHLAHNRPAEAARVLEPVVAAHPNDDRARYQLALAYARMGRDADAREQNRLVDQTRARLTELSDLNRAALRDPWDAGVRRRLAELCEQLGKQQLAEMWHRAAEACEMRPQPGP